MLKEKIVSDTKEAMKSGDQKKLGVLRMMTSALNNKKIEKRGKTGVESELTDEEALEVLQKEAKKRKESIDLFEKGGRADLAQGEKEELAIISVYLPSQMGEAEVKAVVEKIAAANQGLDFGPLMKAVMAELKGKADASLVSRFVKEISSK